MPVVSCPGCFKQVRVDAAGDGECPSCHRLISGEPTPDVTVADRSWLRSPVLWTGLFCLAMGGIGGAVCMVVVARKPASPVVVTSPVVAATTEREQPVQPPPKQRETPGAQPESKQPEIIRLTWQELYTMRQKSPVALEQDLRGKTLEITLTGGRIEKNQQGKYYFNVSYGSRLIKGTDQHAPAWYFFIKPDQISSFARLEYDTVKIRGQFKNMLQDNRTIPSEYYVFENCELVSR